MSFIISVLVWTSCFRFLDILIWRWYFVTRNNYHSKRNIGTSVVNCFQKLLSSWRGTTPGHEEIESLWLWIAFKNYYLRDEEQQIRIMLVTIQGCELLSKIIIFVTRNNKTFIILLFSGVVNCFQKLLSSWRGTTKRLKFITIIRLWIAFKNYYLRDEEQPWFLQ